MYERFLIDDKAHKFYTKPLKLRTFVVPTFLFVIETTGRKYGRVA